ncbi:MAG: replication initiator protein [Arizlama microvirus]|nr:MAG: replication initiator protein [Arizlama microvirus]
MSCYAPLRGWVASRPNLETGRYPIVWSAADAAGGGSPMAQIEVPCGYCIGCKLDKARSWAVRCMHEASLHEENCFLTLTYASAPIVGLYPKDITDFFKRLRKHVGKKIRYFQCGEYGERFVRPHHHIVLFGWRPADLKLFRDGDYPLYTSAELSRLWGHGFVTVGDVTSDSIAYTARYTLKKIGGHGSDQNIYGLKCPEYVTMSRRPGIGADWIKKYMPEYSRRGEVLHDGALVKAPRFYDDYFGEINPKKLLDIKNFRRDNSIERLPTQNYVSQQVAKIRLARKKRSVEDGTGCYRGA